MNSLPLLKLLYATTILLVSWLGLLWAARWSARTDGRGQGSANALAAGIFLGTGLLHFGVEARQGWADRGADYPWAELLALGAFLLLLFVEHVALSDAAHAAAHAHSGGLHERRQHGMEKAGGAVGILIALSLHSFLAGMALGVARDLAQVSLAAVAILAHKLTEGFALGTVLSKDLSPASARFSEWTFALATPLGILLGALALQPVAGQTGSLFHPVVGSLAAGTFLYIGAFDLLQDEFVRPGGRVVKWVLACVGVAVSASMAAML